MATKLFVGKLSFNTTEDSLQALFAAYGTVVSAQIATDRDTNRSRGFAFVEMMEKILKIEPSLLILLSQKRTAHRTETTHVVGISVANTMTATQVVRLSR